MVKTSKARNKIRQFFKNQDKELSVNKGREMLMAQFQENGYVANKFMDKRHMDQVLQRLATRQKNPSLRLLVLEKSVRLLSLTVWLKRNVVKKNVPRPRLRQKNLSRVARLRLRTKKPSRLSMRGGVVMKVPQVS